MKKWWPDMRRLDGKSGVRGMGAGRARAAAGRVASMAGRVEARQEAL